MAYCKQCGKEANAGETFCRHCGAKLLSSQTIALGSSPPENVSEEELVTYIGKNSDGYLAKFRKFGQGGEGSFAVTWHWPAFFFGFFWLLYRKLYGWALLAFFAGALPCVGLLMPFVFGMTANYLYYRQARKKTLEFKAGPFTEARRAAELARAGGVNGAVIVVAPLLVFIAIGVLAAIAVPQFVMYRQRAFDMKAKFELQDACSRCSAILAAHPEKPGIVPDDLLNTGFSPSPDIDMMLLDGRRETFGLSARHVTSTKVFVTDRECRIQEEQQKTP